MAKDKGATSTIDRVSTYKLLRTVLIGIIGGSGLYHVDNLTFVSVVVLWPDGNWILTQTVQEAG